MSTMSLSPVSAGVYAALNVAAMTALAAGPHDSVVPEGAAFPFVWFTVDEENARGLGRGGLRQVNLRVHAAAVDTAAAGAAKHLQLILGKAVELLEDATLTIAGYAQAGEVVYHETTEPFDSIIGGKACLEAASNFTLWAEPS